MFDKRMYPGSTSCRDTERGRSPSLPHSHRASSSGGGGHLPTSTSGLAFRLPAVPATLRASTKPNSAALRTAKDIDFLSHIWLPAILHHPGPPPQPRAPLRYGRRLRTLFVPYSLRSHENCPAEGLPRRPRALTSLLTPETAKKRGRAKGQATS